MPYNMSEASLESIRNATIQRMSMMIYMRTELYKISKVGGSLIRPIIADYPGDPSVDPSDTSSVMFGDHIRAEFQLSKGKMNKITYFPYDEWLDLKTMKILNLTLNHHIEVSTSLNHVGLYQRGNGTIIAYQDAAKYKIDTMNKI